MLAEETAAVKLAVKEVNDAGGINGSPVKLITYDNGTDPTKTIFVIKRLKEKDHVVAIVGPVSSTNNLAAKAWADRNYIPIIGVVSMLDKLDPEERKSLMVPGIWSKE